MPPDSSMDAAASRPAPRLLTAIASPRQVGRRTLAALDFARHVHTRAGSDALTDHRARRLVNLVQSAVTSLGNRALMMVISFVSVPLTIGYLGREQYGAWVTIGSFMAWLNLTDFGLGNGLTNAVTTAAGQDRTDLVRMHLSNGFVVLAGIAACAAAVAAVAWPSIDWAGLFGVQSDAARAEIGPAVAVALSLFLLQFPLTMAGKVYQAYQVGRFGNYWGMAGNLLSFTSLLIVTRTEGGLVWLVVALSGTPFLVLLASNAWTFFHYRPDLRPHWRHANFGEMASLSRVGGKFFLIQITALITFQTDNIVISRFLGAAQVPEYSLTYSLFSYTALPQSIMFSYLWVAYTEAIARRDAAWVRRIFNLNLLAGLGFTSVAVAALVVIARPFIHWWAGSLVQPSMQLVGWVAAWSMINALINPIACLLAAASRLETQLICSTLATITNLVLSIILVQRVGSTGVIAATVLSYSVFVCGPLYIESKRLLAKLVSD